MDKLYWLNQIQPSDCSIVGNKALHLSQLLQNNYPVIPGFVVPARGFWELIEELGKLESLLADLPHSSLHVNVDNPRQLQLVAQQIRQRINGATLPSVWVSKLQTAAQILPGSEIILQPSLWLALKQLPDQILSREKLTDNLPDIGFLDCHICLNSPQALTLGLKRVWGELFRAKSLFYWQRVGIGLHQINLAVTVQPIYNAIASGTMAADGELLQLQATWGLGFAIAKGEVLPDSYQINLKTGKIVASQLGNKTIAYHLSTKLASSDDITPQKIENIAQNIIQPYPLTEAEQKHQALPNKYRQELIDLSQRLTNQFSPYFSLEWTICQSPDSLDPQLYITQFNPHPKSRLKIVENPPEFLSLSSHVPSETQPSQVQTQNSNPAPNLIRGIAAATGKVTGIAQVIIGNPQSLDNVHPGRILVAKSISPHWLPWLKQAAGIVTEKGGMTSHGAILAREIGIPAVVSAPDVTQLFQSGELLLIDGNRGEIRKVERIVKEADEEKKVMSEEGKEVKNLPFSHLAQFPIATQLLVNISQPQSLKRIEGLPVDGVGLLRGELMILNAWENLDPKEWLRQGRKEELVTPIAQLMMEFAAGLMPRKVLYRCLDLSESPFTTISHDSLSGQKSSRGDIATRKTTELSEHSLPTTPEVLSHRGTRQYLSDPAIFDLELAALREVYRNGYSNVQLILPFVRTLEEFVFCRRRIKQTGIMDHPDFRLWIMAEVPSVLFLLPDYIKAGVQGISIGTNDLTQLLLAVNRDASRRGSHPVGLDSTLNGCHPVVMRAIEQLIAIARDAGIPCSICGEAPAQYPEMIDSLVRWGISSISVDVDRVENTYIAIARAEKRLLLEAARERIGRENREWRES